MAEFNLNRFKYTWQGNWSIGTSYNRDDAVKYGGSSWVCRRQHTSSSFASDQTFLPEGSTEISAAWIKMTDGYLWRDQWQTATLYNPGDIVLYGGVLYLAMTSHTSSNFEDNSSNWIVYGSQLAWTSGWQALTAYRVGDLVKYGGIVYRCTQVHTSSSSSAGLENDQSKWQIVHESIEYKGDWSTETRYKINDIVKYGGTLFRCKKHHTPGEDSTLNFDQEEFWEFELPGFQPSGIWNATTVYQVGDVVRHGGLVFYSLSNNYNSNPTSSTYQIIDRQDPPDWEVLSNAVRFQGNYNSQENYIIGDVVRRGGNLYLCLLDTQVATDESTLSYLDSSNWELITVGQNFRSVWQADIEYAINDLVVYLGNLYKCNFAHASSDQNFPGDNGEGLVYWDTVIQSTESVGMQQRGDLLTYNLSRSQTGDGSTFGATRVPIGQNPGQLVSINDQDTVIYKSYGQIQRVRYVDSSGIDDANDPERGISPFKPWKTVRFACEQADDDFNGTTTIKVQAGDFYEILPIIVPARVAIVGAELRTTTIRPNDPIQSLSNDSFYTNAVLTRISQLIQAVIAGTELDPPKTPTNTLDPVVLTALANVSFDPPQFDPVTFEEIFDTQLQPLATNAQAATDMQDLIEDIKSYINFFINSTGSNPPLVGTNTAVTDQGYLNAVLVLEANKEFFAQEAVAFMQSTYPSYNFDSDLCKRDVRRFIDAWKYDIVYTGNYKSLLAARYYRNAVLGSLAEDMFYLRDATGLRNLTVSGLQGALNPANVFDLYRLPTGGSFVSLDPGWGPADSRTWIVNRSPYVQGVTTVGTGCIGQKIDGSLHNGGNKSIVSNDFTQVISDGIGAWVTNNGRAELVSVFSYYAHVGYLASEGGIIRATNGNCSYGRFGAIADGNDPTETPRTGSVDNRNTGATVAAFAGDFTDTIQILEWTHAGERYSQASASFVGAGVGAEVVFEDFRDDAVFECRILDAISDLDNPIQSIGGGGYTRVQNTAQVHQTPNGDLTSITIAIADPNLEEDYLGMRIIITGGPGTGQYGYITGYNSGTKVVSVARESNNSPGWDHVVPGTAITVPLTGATSYRIEPRPIFSDPGFSATESAIGITTNWGEIVYGETTETYNNVAAQAGTGSVEEQDGLEPITATFNVIKEGRNYSVSINEPGAGYARGQTLTIAGNLLGGATPVNDLTITVTQISEDSTNSIDEIESSGTAASGKFLVITEGGTAGLYSNDGETWPDGFSMPTSGDWNCLAAGNNRFVAIRTNSSVAASSLNGTTWTTRSMPANRQWSSVTFGAGKFVAIARNLNSAAYSTNGTTWTSSAMPTIGDSTINEWVDITYGKGKFVAVANTQNIAAYSGDGINWTGSIMEATADSSQKDWVSVAYGNNRFVAISSQGDISWSFDGENWAGAVLPVAPGSSQMLWKKIRYGQGIFFAVCEAEGGGATDFAATSQDGILWTPRTLDTSTTWKSIAFGNPYIEFFDSTVGKNTPVWAVMSYNSPNFNKINTGAKALGRAVVVAGRITEIKLWDTGSGYIETPSLTLVDPNNTSSAIFENRTGDGVLTNPSWLNRGLGYRSSTTRVTVAGDGYADRIPTGKFVDLENLTVLPRPGSQVFFAGNSTRYTTITVEPLSNNAGSIQARIRVSPELRVRDKIEHGTSVSIRERYSQCRITGHDFLDIGTGNFEETNYPELYNVGFFSSAPENEIIEEDGGRVFYTSTDQSGNFRTGELFAVEQATGIVTISADFFDLSGLTELNLGGIRVGGSGTVIREFSTDPLFTEDSNNIVPTQRAIIRFLGDRLSLGGSEVEVGSIQAGQILLGGPDIISNSLSLKIVFRVRADFIGPSSGISGSMLAQTMFYKSFYDNDIV